MTKAQSVIPDTTTRLFWVPLLFYSPDTKIGGGAAGVVTFVGSPFRSSITFGLAYTQRKQFLIYFPYQLYSQNQKWRLYGEIGWYRFFYQYYGIGNKYPNSFSEGFTAKFPRVRSTLLRHINGPQFAGIRLFLDDFDIVEIAEAGEIAQGNVPGAKGGLASSLGAVWLLDTRDIQFYPGDGWLIEASLTGDHRLTGSDFQYARFSFDAVQYRTIFDNHKIAIQFLSILSSPGVPFFNMPLIGTPRRLRGYPEGKYRDRNLILAQAEWRFPIVWRFKGVVFGGAGSVFGTEGENAKIRPNLGAGLRFEFDRKQHLHMRLDYGFGKGNGNSGAYLTIGEAF